MCTATIWEPACGAGNLAKVFVELGIPEERLIATDLKDRGYGISGIDFLQEKDSRGANIIITNPPYSLATEFAEHALRLLPEGGLYIALMNISYLAGQDRYRRLYATYRLREVYIHSKRIDCWKNNERPNDKCGSMTNFAWYVFQKGWVGFPTLHWLYDWTKK